MFIMFYMWFVRVCAIAMLGAGVLGVFKVLSGKTDGDGPGEVSTLVLLLAPAGWCLWGVSLLNIGQPWAMVVVPIAIAMGVGSTILKNRAKTS